VYRLSKQAEYHLEYENIRDYLAGKPVSLQTVREAVIDIRKSKLPDPEKTGNAGSFFMNPYISVNHFQKLKNNYSDIPFYPFNEKFVKIPAAWLIEKCGLKGLTEGGAAVHDKHALIIINQNHATGREIALLAEKIVETVKNKFDIELQPEVNYI